MKLADQLKENLNRIDGKSYGFYKDIKGWYDFGEFSLNIDYIQPDPFAPPSQVAARVSQKTARFPRALFNTPVRRVALEDCLTRHFYRQAQKVARGRRGTGHSGLLAIDRPSQEVLMRTAMVMTDDWVEARFVVGLPARGRRISGREASEIFFGEIPELVRRTLIYSNLDGELLEKFVDLAEDGRFIENVDISPFIRNLPLGLDTRTFSSSDASGSTSQAANIMEALEAGATLLLVDEDTSATNFMIRDERMQSLVAKEKEPITPFIDKVKQLYLDLGVSTILVMGGSGDYFDVADTVIMMDEYLPRDRTEAARSIAQSYSTRRKFEGGERFGTVKDRRPLPDSFDPRKGKKNQARISARSIDSIAFGRHYIDLSQVEQLVDISQTRAIGDIIHYAVKNYMNGERTLREILDLVEADLDRDGMDVICPYLKGNYARPRRYEIAAAINRLRTLKCG